MRWIAAARSSRLTSLFKGVDERAEFCDVPIFSGDKEIYRKVGSPDICIHLPGGTVFATTLRPI